MSNYKPIRSLGRGLDALAALNELSGGTARDVSRQTGIHRTTVTRILETLCELGFLTRHDANGVTTYQLTLKVRTLSEGFLEETWVREIALPHLEALQRDVVWPTSLATFDRDAMIIRETTHRLSPFSVHHAMVGKRLPVLKTALGRAYFAASEDHEREIILRNIAASEMPDKELARDATYLDQILKSVRQKGYATSVGETQKEISSLAIPVQARGHVVCALSLVFFSSAMTIDEAAARYVPRLKAAVAQLEDGLKAEAPAGA